MIKVGEKVPAGKFTIAGANGPETLTSAELFDNKKVVVFGVPGAFTSTCSSIHLPGFVVHADEFQPKGVDTVACLSVNDVHVLRHWSESQNAEKILMLADGNADYVTALGLQRDMTDIGFGIRSERFAMIVDNGVVTHVAKEEVPKGVSVSSAEAMLKVL